MLRSAEKEITDKYSVKEMITSTKARVLRFGDNVGFTPLAAITSSGVLQDNGYRD